MIKSKIKHLQNLSTYHICRGFSLVELMTVIAIVGILSTMGFFSYKGYYDRSRQNQAKYTLNALVTFADTYKANTGFLLPNMKQMNFPLTGTMEYSYKVVCRDEEGEPLWDNSKTCGVFQSATAGRTAPRDQSRCWMGYILYHYYSAQAPDQYPPNLNYQFKCKDRQADPAYQFRENLYPGLLAFPTYDEYATKKDVIQPYFKIADPTFDPDDNQSKNFSSDDGSLCNLSSADDEKGLYNKSTSHACWNIKEFAMNKNHIKTILGNSSVHEQFISNPNRLVITAVGCKEKQSGGCTSTHAYHWIRINSETKILTVCSSAPDTNGNCP